MFNRKFVLLLMTGALVVGGSSLSCASNVSNADAKTDGSDILEHHLWMGASHPGPFARPVEILDITAKSDNRPSVSDAKVLDGQEESIGPIPDWRFFTYPVTFPD